jgi:uncharacterized protein YjbJ (UPF0337 family)
MSDDYLQGEGRDIGGKIKETAGDVVGDPGLQAEGLSDQLAGKVQKVSASVRDAVSGNAGPLLERGREFARKRPFAALAVAGVVGLALLNTMRGRR